MAKNSAKPLVSVCCLAYNQEKTIAGALDNILAQKTDFDFEIIVHDDASTDSTAEIIRNYADRYPDIIRPIFQKINQYYLCNLAQTYLTPQIRGEYVAICEGDDYWTDPDKLQIQADCMRENPNRSLCFHAVTQIGESGEMPYRPIKQSGAVASETVIRRGGMFCPTVSLFFRRDVAENWPEFRAAADVYDYPLQVLAATMGEVYYIDRIMGAYRFASGDSWTARRAEKTDRAHTENETRWLELFDKYTEGKYKAAIDYHMAHLWFTEYRKTLDPADKKLAKKYYPALSVKERFLFSVWFSVFKIFGKRANKLWEKIKQFLLK